MRSPSRPAIISPHAAAFRRCLAVGFLVAVSVLLAGCGADETDPIDYTNVIGVYNGDGAYDDHVDAMLAALDSLGRDAETFSAEDAQRGLDDFAMVIFGAGNPRIMVDVIGFTGRQNVRRLVDRGGGYLGLGAGAYLAADTLIYDGTGSAGSLPFSLFRGVAVGPINALAPVNESSMAVITLTDGRFDPDLLGGIASLYRGGPEWVVADPPYTPMAIFEQTGGEAGLSFPFGFGRVALVAFHPEIDEDNPRDGTSVGDQFDDPESEWFMIARLVEWCMREF